MESYCDALRGQLATAIGAVLTTIAAETRFDCRRIVGYTDKRIPNRKAVAALRPAIVLIESATILARATIFDQLHYATANSANYSKDKYLLKSGSERLVLAGGVRMPLEMRSSAGGELTDEILSPPECSNCYMPSARTAQTIRVSGRSESCAHRPGHAKGRGCLKKR